MDKAVFSALEYDVSQVLKFASQIDPWLACHLTDFLHHCGQLEIPTEGYIFSPPLFSSSFSDNLLALLFLAPSLPCDVREHFVLEYAGNLMNQQSLWRLAVDYFLTCPVFGRPYIEQHLNSLALTSEKKANKILAFCKGCLFRPLVLLGHFSPLPPQL